MPPVLLCVEIREITYCVLHSAPVRWILDFEGCGVLKLYDRKTQTNSETSKAAKKHSDTTPNKAMTRKPKHRVLNSISLRKKGRFRIDDFVV